MMTDTATPTPAAAIHPFEKSLLGKAPFRFVCLIALPASSLCAANPSAYNAAIREATDDAKHHGVHVGTCNHCGMGIMANYVIVSADGLKSVVGCDCVRKTEWAGADLVRAVTKAETQRRRAVRKAASERRRMSKAAERRNTLRAKRAEWAAANAEAMAIMISRRNANPFLRSLLANVLKWGGLTPKQTAAIMGSVEREKIQTANREAEAVRIAAARHVGTVGERLTTEVTCVRRITGGSFAMWTLTILRTPEGCTLTTFGRCPIEQGETVKIKCTVKEHRINKKTGEPETLILRIKKV